MKNFKHVGLVAFLCLVSACAQNPDGTTPNILSDLGTILGDEDVSPQQSALREQAETYNDYAETRIGAALGGALLGSLIGLATADSEEGAIAGAVAGGIAGYVAGSYLTRDHSQFHASKEALEEDIAVANELMTSSRRNVSVARSALRYQKTEIARLNREYADGLVSVEAYETMLTEIATDRESVRSMISTTVERIASMEQSIKAYRRSGFNISRLEASKNAQMRDIANLREIEDAMVALIAGAPDGISRPSV